MAWPRPKTKETIFNDFLIYNTSDQGGQNKRIERQIKQKKTWMENFCQQK